MNKKLYVFFIGVSSFVLLLTYQNCGKGFSSTPPVADQSSNGVASTGAGSPPPPAISPLNPLASAPPSVMPPPIFPPSFVASPALRDASFFIGDPLVLQASRASGTDVKYRWYKDGILIPDVTTNRFEKMNPIEADAGIYKFEAFNTAGSVSVSVVVTAKAPVAPQFISPLALNGAGISIYEGDSITLNYFQGMAIGGGVKYRWFKNDVIIDGAVDWGFRITGTLADSGSYKLEAYNVAGVATFTTQLTVIAQTLPVFIGNLADKAVNLGDVFILNAPSARGGGIKYRWYKDDMIIANQTNLSLMIGSATNASAGVYKLEAYNSAGSAFLTANVTIN